MLTIVVACDRNGAIGKEGGLPWRQSTDLQHFKRLTLGRTIVMGRKTWDSLPGKLPDRRHIVMSRSSVDDVEVMDYDSIMELQEDVFIIGGGEIYRLFIENTNAIHRTIIDTRISDADTHFPDITGMGFSLKEELHVEAGKNDENDMVFQHWTR